MIIVLMGAPGAGKGTQADILVEQLGFFKMSTGDVLRKHITQGTDIGLTAKSFMNEGKLVPDEILASLLNAELRAVSDKVVLLDGYPRNISQAKTLSAGPMGDKIAAVVHIDVEQNELLVRLSGRQTCGTCGASYHRESNPGLEGDLCRKCGGSLFTRPDDQPEKIKTRLGIYENDTKPVLDFYKDKGLYHKVEGKGTTEKVAKDLNEILKQFIPTEKQ